MRTQGISPKLWAAVAMAVLGYLATQEIVDFPGWADLLVQVGLVAGGVAVASPGTVVRDERGQSLIEACFALAFLAIAIWVLTQVL